MGFNPPLQHYMSNDVSILAEKALKEQVKMMINLKNDRNSLQKQLIMSQLMMNFYSCQMYWEQEKNKEALQVLNEMRRNNREVVTNTSAHKYEYLMKKQLRKVIALCQGQNVSLDMPWLAMESLAPTLRNAFGFKIDDGSGIIPHDYFDEHFLGKLENKSIPIIYHDLQEDIHSSNINKILPKKVDVEGIILPSTTLELPDYMLWFSVGAIQNMNKKKKGWIKKKTVYNFSKPKNICFFEVGFTGIKPNEITTTKISTAIEILLEFAHNLDAFNAKLHFLFDDYRSFLRHV